MFRCSECGNEYDLKPEYCDCGNDIFEEIIVKKNVDDGITQKFVSQKTTENKIKSEPKRLKKKNNFNPISSMIFVICIVLSIVVIFFIGNPKDNNKNITQKSEQNHIEIPSIDSFWDNTEVKAAPKQSNEEKPTLTQKIEQIFVPNTQKINQIKSNKNTNTNQAKQMAKTTPIVKKQKTAVNTLSSKQKSTLNPQVSQNVNDLTTRVKNNISYNSQISNNKSQNNVSAQAVVQSKTQNQNPTVQNTNTQNVQQTQTSVAPQTKSSQEIKKELSNYKIGLQNTIGRKINFARVVGDGECVVSFQINSNGKLINRSFTKQSTNLTLNDAVYSAMLSTPSYSIPPQGYKNEVLNLSVKFYDGNFSINLY